MVAYQIGKNLSPETAGQEFFVMKDHQGSVRAVADATGRIVGADDYLPYGKAKPLHVSSQAGNPPWKWQGKELDADGQYEFYYFGARYWNPDLGIWLTPDPAGQFANPYGYGGDPVNGVDPDGRWIHIAVGAAIGAVAGAAQCMSSDASCTGSILGGAAVGALAAGTGGLAGAAAGGGIAGGIAGGAAGGAVAGGANYLRQTDNITGGGFAGAIMSGGMYGAIGGGIGGGITQYGLLGEGGSGAFWSGAVASGAVSKIRGNSWSQAGKSALIGGAASWASYEVQAKIRHSRTLGEKDDLINKPGLRQRMANDMRRSVRGTREYAGLIQENGDVVGVPPGPKCSGGKCVIGMPQSNEYAGTYHTHPLNYDLQNPEFPPPGFSPVDNIYFKNNELSEHHYLLEYADQSIHKYDGVIGLPMSSNSYNSYFMVDYSLLYWVW